ncbi:hypothetical protein B0H14DRAFT_3475802 [Mycena olivaceomarginata]|nr:hypothetical protein B0H14DRAFT_3475802 [Mycena olivaceomarginata]
MFWNPTRDDFVSADSGKTVTRGLGKLDYEQTRRFSPLVNDLLNCCKALRRGLVRLQTIPATFERMVLGVTNLQRAYLELSGLLRYLTVYRPRMWDPKHVSSVPDDNTIGVFTSDPVVAENFDRARLPYWLIHPLAAFHRENILRVVEPLDAAEWMELEVVEGFPPIRRGSSLQQRIEALHAGTSALPWYKNPFIGDTSRTISLSIPESSVVPASTPGPSRNATKSSRHHPYNQSKTPQKSAADPKGQERNKYAQFDSPYMAAPIPAWAAALAAVDRSRQPVCGRYLRDFYVLPEPAMLVTSEPRCNLYLCHYELIRDALLYRLGDVEGSGKPLAAAE